MSTEFYVGLVLGAIAGAAFTIEYTRKWWWSHGALDHYKQLQDKVYRYESRAGRPL